METFRMKGPPETVASFNPNVREVSNVIRQLALGLEGKETGLGDRIMAHITELNPEEPQRYLAFFHAKQSLEWLRRLGGSLHVQQLERDFVHVTPPSSGCDVYINTHDGHLYVRTEQGGIHNTVCIESADQLEELFSRDRDTSSHIMRRAA